jgi:hypothetical protein
MNMPALAAEASLYKSTSLYRGYAGRSRLDTASNVVTAANACEIACGVADAAAIAACALLGPWAVPCWAAAQAATVVCLSRCQGGGGNSGGSSGHGGPPPPPPICDGTRCLPGQICCRCENVGAECLSPGLCDRLCRQPGGPAQ